MTPRLRVLYQKYALQRRFLLVGGCNTVVGVVTYPLLCGLFVTLHTHYQLTLVLSQIWCISFSYLTNKYFVFKTQGISLREYWRFTLFYNLIFALNFLLLPLLVHGLQLSPAHIQLVINILIVIGSYFWHRRITFKR